MAAYGLDVGGVSSRVVYPADGLLHEPLDGPPAVPAQGPVLGGESAARGKAVGGAAGGDVLLQEDTEAYGVGGVEGAVPAGEVEQARAGEGAGEVQQPPAVLADVKAGGVELGVHPAERG